MSDYHINIFYSDEDGGYIADISDLKEWSAKATEVKRWRKESQEYREALVVMENNPTDPAANLAAGRYLCFVKGDWERGVPNLALGSDAELKAVAIMERRGANSAEQQAAIGNAWWDAAEARQGSERDTLRLRAGFWYRQAEPHLAAGLAALRIKQRLEELTKLGREISTSPRVRTASHAPPPAVAPFDEKTAKRHQMAWAKHLKVPVEMTNSIGMRFVLIPPGEFDRGSTAEAVARLLEEGKQQNAPAYYPDRLPTKAPRHRVRISRPFYLGLYEVTQAEYGRVVGQEPSNFKGDPNRPVEQVTWRDTAEFCQSLSMLPKEKASGAAYRLPTEAEWEFACRAGTMTRYSFGDAPNVLSQHAWWLGNSQGQTHPVGQLLQNAWGLFDMHGNVGEWCEDRYGPYPAEPVSDPGGAAAGELRVLRGGSFDYVGGGCRSAYRNLLDPRARYRFGGFRAVLVRSDAS